MRQSLRFVKGLELISLIKLVLSIKLDRKKDVWTSVSYYGAQSVHDQGFGKG